MPDQVGIIVSAAAYRRGLAGALDAAGYEAVEPADVAEWVASGRAAAALVGLVDAGSLATVVQLADSLTVVGLIPSMELAGIAQAIDAGATGVADWDAPPERIVDILLHALEGHALIPVSVLRQLGQLSEPAPQGDTSVSPEQAQWLRYLADGHTVADLAKRVGYSERTMFRKLDTIYGLLGARNRVDALMAAQRLDLFEDEVSIT